ncbi:hypothetical protein [Paramaledivibacter caminithermalis]|jgi:hypothetical protein|uniref:Uncharacterized protein n=1 Tax=Paramaledivibacter caminithermalis (strain DSM 15212 / CIP 107654 / DViRD3) TaxID=1121301 RepID=A0A1M6NDZ0_PARC5|nr:hypothetical protein [Paramaledivibacter caminithermalis]SHJ93863.1 hypothetical protein SAMN02745912_01698 [Paramaledivibacter caminithermalis DSM 15212]
MKKKSIVFLLITILSIVSISGFALNERKTGWSKNHIVQNKAHEEANRQIEAKILDAWTDIENTFGININKYYVVGELESEKLRHYFGEETTYLRFNVIRPIADEVPLGSIVPVMYISHDKKEILYCYKEPDGTNVMKKIKLDEIDWRKKLTSLKEKRIDPNVHETKRVQGKLKKEIDRQKIKILMENEK